MNLSDTMTGVIEMPFRGEKGDSAYDIAVKYGYEGSEEEWVESLGFIPDGSLGIEKFDAEVTKTIIGKEDTGNKGQPLGYAPLDEYGQVPEIYIPGRDVEIPSVEVESGFYFLSTSKKESDIFSVTNKIFLGEGDKITWSTNTSITSSTQIPALVKFADADAEKPSALLVEGVAGYCTYEFIAEKDMYVAFSIKNSDGYTCEITRVPEYKKQIEKIYPTVVVEETGIEYQAGYIQASTGVVTATTSKTSKHTSLIKLKRGECISFYSKGYQSGTAAVLYEYDKNEIPLRAVITPTDNNYTLFTYTEIKDEGYYKVSCYTMEEELKVEKYASAVEMVNAYAKSNADSHEHYKLLFEKAIFIGDSLTKGVLGTINSTNSKISFPYYIGKLTEWEITNAGHPSYTTQQFLENDLKTLDFTDKDVCFIYLGQNGGFTDGSESDVQAMAYCSIIEYIKEQNPDIHIFMLVGGGTNATTVLPMIAEKYDLPCLDIYRNQYFTILKNLDYHPYKEDGVSRDLIHFGRVGYLDLAKSVLNMTFDYISENKSRFEYPYP